MVTPAAKREAVAHLQALLDVSERRACRVIAADRTVIRYQSRRADDHADDDAQHEADAVVGFDEFHFFLLLFSFPVFASESL